MSQGPLIRVHLLLQRTDIRNVHFLIKLLLLSLVPSVVVFTYLLACCGQGMVFALCSQRWGKTE
jgi:hypothetical protein